MKTNRFAQSAGALVALAVCAACAAAPIAPNLSAVPAYAPIVPDGHAATDYEYIIGHYGSYASIFDYPKSDQQIGTIKNVGGQGCTNVLYGYGKKIIWIVAGPKQISEYKVPSTLIRSLSTSFSFPTSCAMNTSGDLAIGNIDGGQVEIFTDATGKGTIYKTPLDEEFFDGYDPQGDLFADGFTDDRSGFGLVELPKGSNKFESMTTSNAVEFPGSVQWDGKYLVVTDQRRAKMFRYTVSGTKATLKGSVSLTGSGDCAQTWIVTGLVYCGDAGNNDGEVYSYPAGGKPLAVFSGKFDYPLGVTAAEK
jgi:hypothetical protein